jgi:diguanylate cyclase (GGDEF)-like protein
MPSTEPLVAILAAAGVALTVLAALLTFALRRHGPLTGGLLGQTDSGWRPGREDGVFARADAAPRGVARNPRLAPQGADGRRASNEELEDVLHGTMAAETYNRAVRVLVWSFILVVLLMVSVGQLWVEVEPQILATLTLGGLFVLVVHELMPAARVGTGRIVLEASAAIVFLTMLVLLTGYTTSPFFFLYAIFVGGSALVAAPAVTVILTVETAAAYALAAFAGPLSGDAARNTGIQIGINLTALVLLAYAGMVISGVQRRTREAAIRLSTVDSLTDLYNRAFMFNAVEREIERSRRYRRGFCLLMMDLDGLKAINDHFGHYEGDVVLRGVATAIKSSLRTIDVAARYGGDEFVALLPETDPSGAYVVAEKIRQIVNQTAVEEAGQLITTSLSIGVVSHPEDGETADELMIAADEAMYLSKRLGKNRVVGYAEPQLGFRPQPRDRGPRPGR